MAKPASVITLLAEYRRLVKSIPTAQLYRDLERLSAERRPGNLIDDETFQIAWDELCFRGEIDTNNG